jgi:hypothetical protein
MFPIKFDSTSISIPIPLPCFLRNLWNFLILTISITIFKALLYCSTQTKKGFSEQKNLLGKGDMVIQLNIISKLSFLTRLVFQTICRTQTDANSNYKYFVSGARQKCPLTLWEKSIWNGQFPHRQTHALRTRAQTAFFVCKCNNALSPRAARAHRLYTYGNAARECDNGCAEWANNSRIIHTAPPVFMLDLINCILI